MTSANLSDNFGRLIEYLRLSITDRCDFRCIYCMAEEMTFLPRKEVLSHEELVRLSQTFVDLGVSKIRITGGEPLIRNDALHLLQRLGAIEHLQELCLTTNGSQLTKLAKPLAQAGVKRINVSLDSLRADRFKQLTRVGDLQRVLDGIECALDAGFEKIKINAVLMKNYNLDEALPLASYALERGMDISFIEEMPLGEISSHARDAEFISSEDVRNLLATNFQLNPSEHSTGGPSRYWEAEGYAGKIGFISPHTDNFCASCNRVRVTASGRLLLCLGNEHSVDLKQVMRANDDDQVLRQAIIEAMQIKPEKHEFDLTQEPQILRFMNATGG
ncbi:GTP 3',8-cyclase MoaA [Agarilytica rhodophyticola]|uniref:GTP 3',8-cyclase MoaA n=1 Tax=Agarilytica rhodophyticola TaxID=1737490 RepID=UPI000B348C49|nr:GTP 3',8-cyclase MoaA [Agarilytica rhodophyticola]